MAVSSCNLDGRPGNHRRIGNQTDRAVKERVSDFSPIQQQIDDPLKVINLAGIGCDDCGTPFCTSGLEYPEPPKTSSISGPDYTGNIEYYRSLSFEDARRLSKPSSGCPAHRDIPGFVKLYSQENYVEAFRLAEQYVTLTGLTGQSCHHPCEHSCTYADPRHGEPVDIRLIERLGFQGLMQHVERHGWKGVAREFSPSTTTTKRVAVVGSGPAGFQAARTARQMGYEVEVFEKSKFTGGTPRNLVPQPHLDPKVLDFYHKLFIEEGVNFHTETSVGNSPHDDISWSTLENDFEAVFLALGAERTNPYQDTPGHDLKGVLTAAHLLAAVNSKLLGSGFAEYDALSQMIKNKRILIVGAGYTADDAATTAGRMGASEIYIIKRSPEEPQERRHDNQWPTWPRIAELELPYAKEEFSNILRFMPQNQIGEIIGNQDGSVEAVRFKSLSNAVSKTIKIDLVVFATGFTNSMPEGVPIERHSNGLYLPSKKLAPIGDGATGPSFYINALAHALHITRGLLALLNLH